MSLPWYRRLAGWCNQRGRVKILAEGNSPYMYRFRVFSSWLVSVYIHRIVRSDASRDYHDHPWPFFHLILETGYTEEFPQWSTHGLRMDGKDCRFESRPAGYWAFHSAGFAHRVELFRGRSPFDMTFVAMPPHRPAPDPLMDWTLPLAVRYIPKPPDDVLERYRVFVAEEDAAGKDAGWDLERLEPLEAWTLVIVGPRVREWGFVDRLTGCWTAWRDYLRGVRCGE